jgi:hypothetical protein
MDITTRLSIIMTLIVLCVIWENITSLMRGAKFWEKWENMKYPEVGQSSRISSREENLSGRNVRDSGMDGNAAEA